MECAIRTYQRHFFNALHVARRGETASMATYNKVTSTVVTSVTYHQADYRVVLDYCALRRRWLVRFLRRFCRSTHPLCSDILSLHLPIASAHPKPPPNAHRYSARLLYLLLSLRTHLLTSFRTGQPSNILYSYLHTNYVRLSAFQNYPSH